METVVNVSAIIVTRGDVDLSPVLTSLPPAWETVIYDNGARDVILNGRSITTHDDSGDPEIAGQRFAQVPDVSVYGRYAAIEYASHDVIYVQDDDVIVSDPQAIVDVWASHNAEEPLAMVMCHVDDVMAVGRGEHIVCNMPQEFRHDFYREHALVGFGAAFHRDSPERAFRLMKEGGGYVDTEVACRTCDIVFTALTPRILVDVPKTNLPYAEDANRMYRQSQHQAERAQILALALAVKEAT